MGLIFSKFKNIFYKENYSKLPDLEKHYILEYYDNVDDMYYDDFDLDNDVSGNPII